MGKAITGHHHDVILVQVGGGNNGKGALINAGIRTALGDYVIVASPRCSPPDVQPGIRPR